MPRIRTIIPEFWEDERFSNVSLPALLLYIGMKNFAADDGVITANPVVIKSKVFPAREDVRRQQVSQWLQELIENSVLVPLNYEGKGYYVMDFSSERIDKPKGSNIPESVIESALKKSNAIASGINEDYTHYSRLIESSREQSGIVATSRESSRQVENILAGEERRGKESKGGECIHAHTRETHPPNEESENFKKFKAWIDTNAPNVGKMKNPFTESEFEGIKRDFPIAVIESVLLSMHNYRELLRKYVSANLTFRKWAKKDMEDGKYRKTTGGTTSIANSGVSDDYKRNILERLRGAGCSSNVSDD